MKKYQTSTKLARSLEIPWTPFN